MRYLSLSVLSILLLLNCSGTVKQDTAESQSYGNTTENTMLSSDKIDGYTTYEISFSLDKPADCITVDIESVYLQKSFPLQKIPERTFFIIEKLLTLPQLRAKSRKNYTPIGRNYNNDWEIYSPVKICSGKNDPLSQLDMSEYRIRFTTFEKTGFYYIITIQCNSRVVFRDEPPVKTGGRSKKPGS